MKTLMQETYNTRLDCGKLYWRAIDEFLVRGTPAQCKVGDVSVFDYSNMIADLL